MPPALRLLISAAIAYATWWLIVIAQAFFPIFKSVFIEEAIAWALALGLGAAFWIVSNPDAGFDLKAIIHAQRLKYLSQRRLRADVFESLNLSV